MIFNFQDFKFCFFWYVWGCWFNLTKIFGSGLKLPRVWYSIFFREREIDSVLSSQTFADSKWMENKTLPNKNFMVEFSSLHLFEKLIPVDLFFSCLIIGEWWSTAAWNLKKLRNTRFLNLYHAYDIVARMNLFENFYHFLTQADEAIVMTTHQDKSYHG